MSSTTIGSRLAAVRPVIPSPNGTAAWPMWWRSMPLVAASVSDMPLRSIRYRDDTWALSATRVPSTTVSRSYLPGLRRGCEPQELMEEPELGHRVVGGRRVRHVGVGGMPARAIDVGCVGGGGRRVGGDGGVSGASESGASGCLPMPGSGPSPRA